MTSMFHYSRRGREDVVEGSSEGVRMHCVSTDGFGIYFCE